MDPSPETYDRDVQVAIFTVYSVFAIIWITIMIYILQREYHIIHVLVGLLPMVSVFLGLSNIRKMRTEDDIEMTNRSILPLGLIFGIGMMEKLANNYEGNTELFFGLVFAGIIFILFSIPDYYFGSRYMSVTRHIRNAIQAICTGIFGIALSLFFVNRKDSKRW